jgi:hypothetical protein
MQRAGKSSGCKEPRAERISRAFRSSLQHQDLQEFAKAPQTANLRKSQPRNDCRKLNRPLARELFVYPDRWRLLRVVRFAVQRHDAAAFLSHFARGPGARRDC